ncbi:early nodulin-like protein 2 [Vigna unguiculata]|uniref:early nodulin-like protein 2 n=1 Tax=Vigna unguiculata TaxID=3917 RepID=UPI00101659AF|nr:early nodulin-like protein 2 [Vigna unguiculata]
MGYSNNRFLGLFLFFISMSILFSSPATACTFFQLDWVPNPSQHYTHWAQRNRFQVNDTLLFKYKSGCDSVLVVKKEDYDSCNTSNAMQEMDGGDSMFTFVKSGPFFFITGNAQNCKRGQKLTVVVLAVRHNKHTHLLSPAATPPTAGAETPAENGPIPSSDVSPSGPTSSAPSQPKHSGSMRFRGSVGVAMGVVSVGVGLFFSILG